MGLGDYAFALAFIVGLLSLIPVIGAVISGIIITALALTVSPTTALITATYYIAYQQIESYFIYPRIMKRSVDIPGSVTVIAALLGGSLMGIIGACWRCRWPPPCSCCTARSSSSGRTLADGARHRLHHG